MLEDIAPPVRRLRLSGKMETGFPDRRKQTQNRCVREILNVRPGSE